MQIHGPTHVHSAQPIQAPHRTPPAAPPPSTSRVSGADQLDISPEADMLSRLRGIPDIRADRVAELRAAIASGSYETEEKVGVALDRLLDEIG